MTEQYIIKVGDCMEWMHKKSFLDKFRNFNLNRKMGEDLGRDDSR